MLVVGLTGGIGAGKSTVAAYIAELAQAVIDTDQVARDVVEPGSSALDEIRNAFGEAVITGAGTLNRAALAEMVFGAAEKRHTLEEILHPRIRAAWKKQLAHWRVAGETRAVVVIPLLFETAADTEVDRVICVGCSAETQMLRLLERGWTVEQAGRRIAAQWPLERKMNLADGVIWNNSTREVCLEQTARLFASKRFSTETGAGACARTV
jgi:dephospho-CoA kinase